MAGLSEILSDYWIQHAVETIESVYGDVVSVSRKAKDLIKFGRSEDVSNSTLTTLGGLKVGTLNETYATTNAITSVISTSASDTQNIVVEGHTISGSDLTFVSQTVALTGTTKATLGTALARCTRMYAAGSGNTNDLVGNVFAYEGGADTSGTPNDGAGVHCTIRAGQNQSEKASTSISSTDYWIVTGVWADCLEKTAANAEVAFEMRQVGKPFRKSFDFSVSNTSGGTFRTSVPYVIVPKNYDVRLRALGSADNIKVSGGIFGVLATTNN